MSTFSVTLTRWIVGEKRLNGENRQGEKTKGDGKRAIRTFASQPIEDRMNNNVGEELDESTEYEGKVWIELPCTCRANQK